TLLAFLNVVQSAKGNTFSPIDIYVNGELKVSHIKPTVRALSKTDAATAYLSIDVTSGETVKVLFKPSKHSEASVKNVIINGFELNSPNIKEQARNPIPSDGDEHVQVTQGGYRLKWTSASGAGAHDLYFGTDSEAVASAPFFR